jgi:hypothetical protein
LLFLLASRGAAQASLSSQKEIIKELITPINNQVTENILLSYMALGR